MIDPRIDDWLAGAADYSPETVKQYRKYVDVLEKWLERRGIQLPDLRPAQFREFLDDRPTWGPVTRHNCLYAIRAFLRATRQLSHPLMSMNLRRADPGPQRTLTMPDVHRLLQACETGRPRGVRNAAMVTLLLDTGLRASELCRLTKTATDLDACKLAVLGKGRRWRYCVFSPATAERIRSWVEIRRLFARQDVNNLFTSLGGPTPGGPLTRYGLSCIWRTLASEAGLPALASHDFRRGFACEAMKNRMPLKPLQEQGGWSSLGTLSGYLRALTIEDARAYLPAADLPL